MILTKPNQEILIDSFVRVLKRSGLLLFVVTILATLTDQWITNALSEILNSPDGLGVRLWIFGGLSLLIGMVVPVIQILLILAGKSQLGLLQFFRQKFKQSLIEMMRSWGKAMSWAFLLIIPGFVYYIRYLFVIFVVCEDPEYDNGEIDALKKSISLSKGAWWKLFGLFFLFAIFIPLLMTFFDEYKVLTENFFTGSLLCFIETLIEILFVLVMLRFYRKRVLA